MQVFGGSVVFQTPLKERWVVILLTGNNGPTWVQSRSIRILYLKLTCLNWIPYFLEFSRPFAFRALDPSENEKEHVRAIRVQKLKEHK